ncbi:hypothetical protein [Desulfolucanica intricata]|uniref:hypothetical protein n=1 Tax=Desulfolucanica intricata TaxID=1285191 RepID=UPI000A908093|nr:hypothetical protein [Desulfolucanica intricata]
MKDKDINCSVNWPCSKSEIIEVIENVGSGKCKVKNKKKTRVCGISLLRFFKSHIKKG